MFITICDYLWLIITLFRGKVLRDPRYQPRTMEISRELKYKPRLDFIFISQTLVRWCLGQEFDLPLEEGYLPKSVYFPFRDERGRTITLMRWWGFRPTAFCLKNGDIILVEE